MGFAKILAGDVILGKKTALGKLCRKRVVIILRDK